MSLFSILSGVGREKENKRGPRKANETWHSLHLSTLNCKEIGTRGKKSTLFAFI